MILVTTDYCPFCLRCVLALNAKGIAFDDRPVDLTQKAAFLETLSPYGRVPVLKVGDHAIYESSVICEYIEETHPQPALLPGDPLRRADARFWIDFCNTRFMPAYFNLLKAEVGPKRDALRAELSDHLTFMDSRGLSSAGQGRPYWMGSEIGLVDFAFYPFFERFAAIEAYRGFEIPEGLAHLHDWLTAVRRHPVVAAISRPRAHHVAYFRAFYAD